MEEFPLFNNAPIWKMAVANLPAFTSADFRLSTNLDAIDRSRTGYLYSRFLRGICRRMGDCGQESCAEQKKKRETTCHGGRCPVVMHGSSSGFWGIPVAAPSGATFSFAVFHHSESLYACSFSKGGGAAYSRAG